MLKMIAAKWALVREWVGTHGGWTKVVGFAMFLGGLLHATCPPVQHAVDHLWHHIPRHIKELCTTAGIMYAWFRNPATKSVIRTAFLSYFKSTAPDGTVTEKGKQVTITEPVAAAEPPPRPPDYPGR